MDLDEYAHRAATEHADTYFRPHPIRTKHHPRRTSVTITTRGVGPTDPDTGLEPVDGSILEPGRDTAERLRRNEQQEELLGATVAPARVLFQEWRDDSAYSFLRLAGSGIRADVDTPLHWCIQMSFLPADESAAKAALRDLARRLGVTIAECRSPTREEVWPDVADP